VNYYGTQVPLSMRGPGSALNYAASSAGELSTYTRNEGAFWGNLFLSSPTAFSCVYGPDAAYARSRSRDCAAGHLDSDGTLASCGIIQRLGSCDKYCNDLTQSGQYYPNCQSDLAVNATSTAHVVTIFLQ
jgi:hypothetical protein